MKDCRAPTGPQGTAPAPQGIVGYQVFVPAGNSLLGAPSSTARSSWSCPRGKAVVSYGFDASASLMLSLAGASVGFDGAARSGSVTLVFQNTDQVRHTVTGVHLVCAGAG